MMLQEKGRDEIRAAVIDMLVKDLGLGFHVTASLHPGASRAALETDLKGWCARVDREYLGRNWQKMHLHRMRGLAFFEVIPHTHAHLIVAPPIGAEPFHFMMNAPKWFKREEAPEMRVFFPKAVTGVAPI